MEIVLENDSLLVAIRSTGAELTRISSKIDHTQYLWKADPEIWGRHAPVLFPIVGRLKDNAYSYQGNTYSMGQHGFARNAEFSLVDKSDTAVWFELRDTPDTQKHYPFPFRLRIGYVLEGFSIKVLYQVGNLGNQQMPFSIGGHPGFTCPIVPGETLTDYVVEFDQEEQAETHLLNESGLFDGRKRPCLQGNTRIPITETLFNDDALVFHHLKSKTTRLLSLKSGRFVEVTIEGFPYLGIWAKPAAPYVCIEPWHGLADYADTSGDIFEKKGIYTLAANRTFECEYTITCQ